MVEYALSTKYFTKEFPLNWEVEWKANLCTNYPFGFINSVRNSFSNGELDPFYETFAMGDMKPGIQYHHLLYHYYGHTGQNGVVRDLVLIQPPESPIFIPQIKHAVPDTGLKENEKHILIRAEIKGGLSQAFHQKKLVKYLDKYGSDIGHEQSLIGTIDRKRYSIYINNKVSCRNFSLVADCNEVLGLAKPLTFSQVEIEYKGISGIGIDNCFSRSAVLKELSELGNKLVELNNGIVTPTLLTKFDFILESMKK